MRKRRILSLLLAVAVMATMIIAVPLTANAADNKWDAATNYSAKWVADGNTETNGDLIVEVLKAKYRTKDIDGNYVWSTSGTVGEWKYTAAKGSTPAYGAANDNMRPSDPAKNASDTEIPAYNALRVSVLKAGTVTLNVKLGTGKYIMVVKEKDGVGYYVTGLYGGSNMTFDGETTAEGNGNFSDLSFDAEVGYNYYIGSTGSKMQYSSVSLTPALTTPNMSLDKEEITLAPGGKEQITAKLAGTSTEDNKITWSIEPSDGKISIDPTEGETITVDASQAQSGDTATITATVKGTDFPGEGTSKTCSVTIKKVPKQGTVDNLKAATETKIYDVLAEAQSENIANGDNAYHSGYLYFDEELLSAGNKSTDGNKYADNKTTKDIDGTLNDGKNGHPKGGIRLKANQDEFALKLANGSAVRLYVYISDKTRYGTIGTRRNITADDVTNNSSDILAKTNGVGDQELLEYTNNTGEDQVVYISATGDSHISQIQVIVPNTTYFGTGKYDSGWYITDSGTTEGVIRFLQGYIGNNEVTSYGFYFINSKGDIEKATISDEKNLTEEGIYADLYGIKQDNTDSYSAMAFVTIGGTTYWAKSITGSISDWSDENKIDNYAQ